MRCCWTTMGANGHHPDLLFQIPISSFIFNGNLFFSLCQKSQISLLGCSSVKSHSDRALSSAGLEPTRLSIRGLRPGQGTARTYQGLPAGVCLPVGSRPSFSEGGEAHRAELLCLLPPLSQRNQEAKRWRNTFEFRRVMLLGRSSDLQNDVQYSLCLDWQKGWSKTESFQRHRLHIKSPQQWLIINYLSTIVLTWNITFYF